MTPELTVIIPTYRRPGLLQRCVTSLDAQRDAPEFTAVVVDDASGDTTPDVLRSLAKTRPWLRWYSLPRNSGPAAARNRAIDDAESRLLLFLDDDVVAAPDLLGRHVHWQRLHRDGTAVLGKVIWHPDLDVSPFMRWLDRSNLQFGYDSWLREGPVEQPSAAFYTANLSVPRDLVVEAGGFDERFPYAAYEDVELAHRLAGRGMRMDYRPDALAFHVRPVTLKEFRARMERVAASAVLMRDAAPDFAFDDSLLHEAAPTRSLLIRRRLDAMLHSDVRRLGAYYWASVANAYVKELARHGAT